MQIGRHTMSAFGGKADVFCSPHQCPLIAISGHSGEGYPEKVIDKGGIDGTGITLLRKPYKKAELAEAVRGVLDQ